jgi:hypothetical protein
MTKKFDSSIIGQPYSRVMNINIRYPNTMTAVVEVILQPHVKLLDGTHSALGSSETLNFSILPQDFMAGEFQLRDVSTGELLGASMSLGALFTGVASLIREKELLAEVVESPPIDSSTSFDVGEGE